MKELVPKDKEKKKPKEDQWSVFDFKQLGYFREKTKEMLEKRFGPVNLDLLDIASRQLNWLPGNMQKQEDYSIGFLKAIK